MYIQQKYVSQKYVKIFEILPIWAERESQVIMGILINTDYTDFRDDMEMYCIYFIYILRFIYRYIYMNIYGKHVDSSEFVGDK